MVTMASRIARPLAYVLALPERVVRAIAAAGGGALHETAQLVLPRLVRKSRLYEATAKNLLRITVELVGGVEREAEDVAGEVERSPKKLAIRKAGGNVVELAVEDPEQLKNIKKGDQVEALYSESLAVKVEAVPKK